jgi:hypothetical protein
MNIIIFKYALCVCVLVFLIIKLMPIDPPAWVKELL